MKYVECDGVFKPFSLAPEVCDTCGQNAEDHSEKRADMLPYKEAVWNVLLREGGTHDFYGGYGYNSEKIRKHFQSCGFNLKKMSTPEVSTVSEFAGTFTDADEVTVVSGVMICKCGNPPTKDTYILKYKGGVEWILKNYSLGQLIWQVVKAGEAE